MVNLRFNSFLVCLDRRQVFDGERPVKIGARAFDVLEFLLRDRQRVVTKDELLEHAWRGVCVEENSLHSQVSLLRKLLGPDVISTVTGIGYKFSALVSRDGQTPRSESNSQTPSVKINISESEAAPIGRDSEREQIAQLLAQHRLVTILGTAGVGKSHLARAVAWDVQEKWRDGVWLVDMAVISDPGFVPFAIANSMGLAIGGTHDDASELLNILSKSELLLILDNCEQGVESLAPFVSSLLGCAPSVRCVATSQLPLGLFEEQLSYGEPLSFPDHRTMGDPSAYSALTLFETRVRAFDPAFRITGKNQNVIAEICRGLDGLPLAIELAAAKVPLLGVEWIRDHLAERFQVLVAPKRKGVARHQRLEAAIQWSYGLLDPDERTVLKRIGVFAGHFGIDEAQSIAIDEDLGPWQVVDIMGSLVQRSLVCVEESNPPSYRLLETWRKWALKELAEAGELQAIRQRHAQGVLATLERSESSKWQESINGRLDYQRWRLDNFRAALHWAASSDGNSTLLVELVGAGGWLLHSLGRRREALGWCSKARSRMNDGTLPKVRARVHLAWIRLRFPRVSDAELDACRSMVELSRKSGDTFLLVSCLCEAAACLAVDKRFDDARRMIDEAYALSDAEASPILRLRVVRSHFWLCWTSERLEEARKILEEGVKLAGNLREPFGVVWGLMRLSIVAFTLGNAGEAIARAREAVAIARRDGFVGKLRWFALGTLAATLADSGLIDEAMEVANEIVEARIRTFRLAEFLDVFAFLALRDGRPKDAARAIGCVSAKYSMGEEVWRDPEYGRIRRSLFQDLNSKLDPVELEALALEGALMGDEEVVKMALARSLNELSNDNDRVRFVAHSDQSDSMRLEPVRNLVCEETFPR